MQRDYCGWYRVLKINELKVYTSRTYNKTNDHQKISDSIQRERKTEFAPVASQYYRANLVTFKGSTDDTEQIKNPKGPLHKRPIGHEVKSQNLVHSRYHDDIVARTIINLANSDSVMVTYPSENTTPQILIDNLQYSIDNNNGAGIGFPPEKTVLYSIDTSEIYRQKKDLVDAMLEVEQEYKEKDKKVIFVLESFEYFLKNQKEKEKLFESNTFKSFNKVALAKISEDDYLEYGTVPDDEEEESFFDGTQVFLSESMDSLTDSEAEELLLSEKFQQKYITNGEKINFSIDSIYKAIDLTGELEENQLPGTAINLLRKTIFMAKMNLKTEKLELIQDSDVEKAYKKFFREPYKDVEEKMLKQAEESIEKNDKAKNTQGTQPTKIQNKKSTPKAKDKKADFEQCEKISIYRNIKAKFKDVGGMQNVKTQIKDELLDLIKNPKVKKQDLPSGALLYGPPGTGKTLLARSIAGEANATLLAVSGSDFVEKFVGLGAKAVRDLYEKAREEARASENKVAFIFIDEIDATAKERSGGGGGNDERESTLNTLLVEMDGIKSKEQDDIKIITIAATNRFDLLDSAIKRPGRFDLKYKIDDPRYSKKARREIIKIHAKDRPFKSEAEKAKLLEYLTETSDSFSGADIADIFKRAYRMTLKLGREKEYITKADLDEAKLQVMSGIKTETESPVHERVKTILHEGGHGIGTKAMLDVYKNGKPHQQPVFDIDLITNEPRGDFSGALFYKHTDNSRYSFESLVSRLVSIYGGYFVEREFFGSNMDGVRGDLQVATQVISKGVLEYGLGPNLGAMRLDSSDEILLGLYKNDIKKDIELFKNLGQTICKKFVEFNKEFLEHYKEQYFENGELIDRNFSGDEFKALHSKWLKDNDKEEEYETLCKEVADMIESARIKAEQATDTATTAQN